MENPDSIYIGNSRLPIQFRFLGFLAAVAGVYNLMDYSEGWIHIVIGIVLILGGIAVITLQRTAYLDTSENKLIFVWHYFFWYHKVNKQQLPEMNYLSVVSVKTNKLVYFITLPFSYSESKCNVNLAFNSSRMRYINLITVTKTKAFNFAFNVAEKANIPVLDATNYEKKWVKSQGDVMFKK